MSTALSVSQQDFPRQERVFIVISDATNLCHMVRDWYDQCTTAPTYSLRTFSLFFVLYFIVKHAPNSRPLDVCYVMVLVRLSCAGCAAAHDHRYKNPPRLWILVRSTLAHPRYSLGRNSTLEFGMLVSCYCIVRVTLPGAV